MFFLFSLIIFHNKKKKKQFSKIVTMHEIIKLIDPYFVIRSCLVIVFANNFLFFKKKKGNVR